MSKIVEEVKASLRIDAVNGDGMERAVFASQVQALIEYVEELEFNIEMRDMGGSV